MEISEKTLWDKCFESMSEDEYCSTTLGKLNDIFKEYLIDKAAAYDRVMSGGKKTLKEWANFLGMNVAVEDEEIYGRRVFASPIKMFLKFDTTIYGTYKFWALSERGDFFHLPPDLIDYSGDWKDSLTLPDGWDEKINQEETFDYNLEQLGLK